jgi:hypothetical protein
VVDDSEVFLRHLTLKASYEVDTDSKDLFSSPTPVVHGFDFSGQGLIGIWEGFNPSSDSSEPESPRSLPKLFPKSLLGSRVAHGSKVGSSQDRSSQEDMRGSFHAAITALAARYASPWKSSTVTSREVQRQVALHLCGWNLNEDELASRLKT